MRGFTLLELIIVIALIVPLAAMGIPVYTHFQIQSQLDSTTHEIVHTLRTAQQKARAGEQNRSWGVSFTASSYTEYADGDSSFDVSTSLPSSIHLSGLSAVTFDRLTGETTNTGTITVSANSINKSHTISINQYARIQQ
jgi:prepilin-type N-terminal cleavage/methylation domain-containing protein